MHSLRAKPKRMKKDMNFGSLQKENGKRRAVSPDEITKANIKITFYGKDKFSMMHLGGEAILFPSVLRWYK